MKICIRAHDLGVKGTEEILRKLTELDLDGVQMVCYKAYDDVPYAPGAITPEKAEDIARQFAAAGKMIPLIGAYFNPVHSDTEKASRCEGIFGEYLEVANAMGCGVVGSETGSFNDDKWTYHPKNRTPEALEAVAQTFGRLCDVAAQHGAVVAMEGAAGHVCHEPEALDAVQKTMNKENLRVIFDLFNYLDQENQFDYLQILERGLALFGERILLFHMKDCLLLADEAPKQVNYGTGDMNHVEILRRIKAHNPDAILVLEGTTGEGIHFAVQKIKEIWECV